MNESQSTPPIDVDGAIAVVVQELSAILAGSKKDTHYGYDIYAPTIAQKWCHQVANRDSMAAAQLMRAVGSTFNEATWEICRRGILRPFVREPGGQGIDQGNGYSFTEYGRKWIADGNLDSLVIVQPGTLAANFSEFSKIFGEGFHQRSQEAIACRFAQAWLACCVMCGAAAESVLLAMALGKLKDESAVLKIYEGRSGRHELTKVVCKGLPERTENSLKNFMGLLAYWRDDAAHGKPLEISQANSDEAVRQLLHLCQWSKKNWAEITS